MGSKEVAVRGGRGVAKWQSQMAKLAQEQADNEQTPGGKFISVRGGQLTIGDDVIRSGEIDVIVVDAVFENDFYQGSFDADSPQTPACFALARVEKEMKPHEVSAAPQHPQCMGCEQNKFGSAEKGNGKACKNTRRLALIAADDLSPSSIKEGEVRYLRIPVTSVAGWIQYVKGLNATYKRPTFGVVTTIHVEPHKKNQVSVTFVCKEPLGDKMVAAIMKRREELAEQIMFPYSPRTADDAGGKKRKSKKDKKERGSSKKWGK